MQKVLLASTALVLTTGWAMADVTNAGDGVGASITLKGEAKMGVIGGNDDDDDQAAARFFTDVDIDFNMVGQTDGGLEFGANVDLDENGAFNGETQGGEELWISGAFGRLTMGDTDGAFDWAMQETDIGDTIGDIEEHLGWGNGNAGLDNFYDGQIARYEYAFGAFSVAASAELDDDEDGGDTGGPILGLAGKYSMTGGGIDMAFGLGVQTVSNYADLDADATVWGLSADLGFGGGIRGVLNYARGDFEDFGADDDGEHYGLAVAYETGPWLFAANYGHWSDWVDGGNAEVSGLSVLDGDGYGLQANYDLGGGAKLLAGISQSNWDDDTDDDDNEFVYSFGVSMTF